MINLVNKNWFSVSVTFILGFFLLSVICPWDLLAQADVEIRLNRGDAIHLFVYDGPFGGTGNGFLENYNDEEFIIDGRGNVRLNTLGEIKIVGMTPEKVNELLYEKFKQYTKEDPIVFVEPLIRITLSGDFQKSGMYRFNPNISFWEMVENAGGLAGLAALENMYVLRKDDVVYQDFSDALHKGQSLLELGLQSGDEIVAPRLNRLTIQTVLRYFQFTMSLITFYLALMNYRARANY
ncbi:polysaccharide biosynthesis/export family protein [candidate division KSB1 bacterium]|nr:polysaccharide biosynthesis/export family protein [candidate division KSB1 bacterium]